MQSRSEAATKFTYNPATDSWQSEKCRVVVDNQPFAEGGMRICLKLYELEDNGHLIPCVAKIFKVDPGPRSYFDEALAQMAAECFAQRFNEYPLRHKLAFLPVSVMLLDERSGQLCNVEPLMTGRYVKHNDNNGHVETKEALPQAFSHWTWEASEHTLVVCDIQGVSDCYTDPQIHSLDGDSFGQGNLGTNGILKFLKTHKCNALCSSLGLPPMHRTVAEKQLRHRMAHLQQLVEGQAQGAADAFHQQAGFVEGARQGASPQKARSPIGALSPFGPKVPIPQRGAQGDRDRSPAALHVGLQGQRPNTAPSKARPTNAIASLLARSGSPSPRSPNARGSGAGEWAGARLLLDPHRAAARS